MLLGYEYILESLCSAVNEKRALVENGETRTQNPSHP